MKIQPDDDVTTHDGRGGVVTGVDPDAGRISFVDEGGLVHHVEVRQIATANQQGIPQRTPGLR